MVIPLFCFLAALIVPCYNAKRKNAHFRQILPKGELTNSTREVFARRVAALEGGMRAEQSLKDHCPEAGKAVQSHRPDGKPVLCSAHQQMSAAQFADEPAHSLEHRSRLLKLMSMNHYDMDENSRNEPSALPPVFERCGP